MNMNIHGIVYISFILNVACAYQRICRGLYVDTKDLFQTYNSFRGVILMNK